MMQMKPPHQYSHPHHAEEDARIIEYLVILVYYKIPNASDQKQKATIRYQKQKATIYEKKPCLDLALNIN